MSALTQVIVWIVIIGIIVGFLWWRGYLHKFGQFLEQTREELRKCSWPTREELKGATIVVLVTMFLLGLYIGLVDSLVLLILKVLIGAAKGFV